MLNPFTGPALPDLMVGGVIKNLLIQIKGVSGCRSAIY